MLDTRAKDTTGRAEVINLRANSKQKVLIDRAAKLSAGAGLTSCWRRPAGKLNPCCWIGAISPCLMWRSNGSRAFLIAP